MFLALFARYRIVHGLIRHCSSGTSPFESRVLFQRLFFLRKRLNIIYRNLKIFHYFYLIGGEEPLGSQVPSMFLNFIGSDIDWKYNTEPEQNACLNSPEQRCYWPRGKVLGGTSVLNGMMYISM